MKTHVKEWKHGWRKEYEGGNGKAALDIPRGEWDNEPDKIQWLDEETGLDCLMHRNHSGTWCGYVGIAESHPLFGKDYDSVDVEVHGGLTYADVCQQTGDEAHGICHVPIEGRPEKMWWFGFDCAHGGDLMPVSLAIRAKYGEDAHTWMGRPDVYRDRAYVENEVTKLARQLKAIPA